MEIKAEEPLHDAEKIVRSPLGWAGPGRARLRCRNAADADLLSSSMNDQDRST